MSAFIVFKKVNIDDTSVIFVSNFGDQDRTFLWWSFKDQDQTRRKQCFEIRLIALDVIYCLPPGSSTRSLSGSQQIKEQSQDLMLR